MGADWAREMRGVSLISAPSLDNWLMFYTRRNSTEAQSLLQNLHKVSGPLGIQIQRAVMWVFGKRTVFVKNRDSAALESENNNVGYVICVAQCRIHFNAHSCQCIRYTWLKLINNTYIIMLSYLWKLIREVLIQLVFILKDVVLVLFVCVTDISVI